MKRCPRQNPRPGDIVGFDAYRRSVEAIALSSVVLFRSSTRPNTLQMVNLTQWRQWVHSTGASDLNSATPLANRQTA